MLVTLFSHTPESSKVKKAIETQEKPEDKPRPTVARTPTTRPGVEVSVSNHDLPNMSMASFVSAGHSPNLWQQKPYRPQTWDVPPYTIAARNRDFIGGTRTPIEGC